MSGSAARFKGEGRALGALLAVALLAGCGLGERLSGTEARINAARALEPSLQGALQSTQAVLSTDASAAESFSRQWSDRLKVRAVTCSRGYKPRFYESLDTVRDRLADVGCFAEADRGLKRWVGLQRTRHVLAQPPLRPASSPVPTLVSHREVIRSVAVARNAPVAVVSGPTGVIAALDLTDGRQLFQDAAGSGQLLPDLSPNGRLFAQTQPGKVTIRAVEGGEPLVELAGATGLLWLDDRVLALTGGGEPLKVLDLASGEHSTIAGLDTGWGVIIRPLVQPKGRYLLLSSRFAAHLELVDVGGRVEGRLTGDKVAEFSHNFSFNLGALSPDAATWMQAGQGLHALNTATLESKEVSLKPAGVQTVWPTSKADEFLLHMHLPTGDGVTSSFRHYLYGRDSPGYFELQRAVLQWSGRPIALFQGRYEGATFSVGGS